MAAINNKTTVFDAGEVFGGRKSGRPVVGFMEPNPYVPDEDIRYVMPEWAGAIAFWFAHVKDPLFVFGPTGCGKTSAVKQLARRINYPCMRRPGIIGWNSRNSSGIMPSSTAICVSNTARSRRP